MKIIKSFFDVFLMFYSKPVSETASAEIRQNDGGQCVGKGIAIVAEAKPSAKEVGQHFAARGFA